MKNANKKAYLVGTYDAIHSESKEGTALVHVGIGYSISEAKRLARLTIDTPYIDMRVLRVPSKDIFVPVNEDRESYNDHIDVCFMLKEQLDRAKEYYFQIQSDYDSACYMAKMMDAKIINDADRLKIFA